MSEENRAIGGSVGAVFLDAVGTLLRADPPAAVVYAEVGRRFGSTLPPARIAQRFATAWAREEARDRAAGYRTSKAREIQRWRAIVTFVLDDVADTEGCFQELYAHFACPESWAVHAQAAALLERLAGEGLRLGMASNFDGRLRGIVAGKPELRPISDLMISSEISWRKPAPEFYAAAIATAALAPANILHVGDDLENDYNGPKRAGMQAVLLDAEDRYAGHGAKRLRQLRDLPAHIHWAGR